MSRTHLLAAVVALSCASTPAAVLASPQATSAKRLHAGEFCSKSKQRYYHRHGYTCRRARDGRNRLFSY